MKTNKELGTVWLNVSDGHRHLPRTRAVIKNEKYILESIAGCGIDTKDIGNVLDWGPGGGWLSRAIGAKNVNFVDIVPGYDDLVRKTQKGHIKNMKFHTLSGPEMPKIADKIDTVILYSVLYHMPSLEYVRRVIEYITSLEPKVILIRNYFTDAESWERTDKYDSTSYIRGNIYNRQEFIKLLPKYDVLYDKVVQNYGTSMNKRHNIREDISSFSSVMCMVKK